MRKSSEMHSRFKQRKSMDSGIRNRRGGKGAETSDWQILKWIGLMQGDDGGGG